MNVDDLALHGDVKTFVVASFTEDDAFSSDTGQGTGVARLKATLKGEGWTFEAHHFVASTASSADQGGLLSTGAALTAPEIVDLTWEADTSPGLTVFGRTDRLMFAWSPGPLKVTIGRQPVSFGTGLVFTPRDLVNPFSPATIDTEYKPGVDAVRVDGYIGTAGRVTGVVAWTGSAPPYQRDEVVAVEDVVVALDAQATVGVTDLQGFAGLVRGDRVVGAGAVTSVGPVGVHGDVTFTVPESASEDSFVRAVVGADGRPTAKTTISGELYLQTLGATGPDDYLGEFSSDRFARGEVWLVGRYYASLAVSQELTPLVSASVAVIGNLGDASALLAPSLSWSVADNAALGLGGYLGLGEGLEARNVTLPGATAPTAFPTFRSEFGTYPYAAFLSLRTYF